MIKKKGGEVVHTATEHSVAATEDHTFHLGVTESSPQGVSDVLPYWCAV